MGFHVGRTAQIISLGRIFATLAVFSLVFAALIGGYTYATDTAINLGVSGSPAPKLYISNLTNPVNVTSMPLTVEGVVDNLTQVQVYVDGAYSLTIPLTVTEQSFSYELNLNEGNHSVKFVGISAYTSDNPEVILTISYQSPNVPPTPPNNGGGTTNPGKKPTAPGGTSSGGVRVGTPVDDSGSDSMDGIDMPAWLYKPLVFFDIINPARATDTSTMFMRFLLLLSALFLIIFARPTLWLYRKVRYDLLHMDKHPLTYILRRYPLFWIRLLGVIIAALVFAYL